MKPQPPLAQRLRHAANQHRHASRGAAPDAQHGQHTTPHVQPEQAQRLDLSALLHLHGDSSLVVLLMLLSAISVLPVAGAGTVMSLGIWAIAWAFVCGRDSLQVPQRLGQVQLNARWSGRCLHGLAWIYEQSNRWLRPRWPLWLHASTRWWWGGWIGLMGVVIFLPLPLGNVLPSLSLILLSLGWMYRDGLAMVLSAATGMAAMAYVLTLWHWLKQLVMQTLAVWPG